MEEEIVAVSLLTRTGHKVEFFASEFKRTAHGYEFVSYPEKRGYKKVIHIASDAVATIAISAPGQFFEANSLAAPAPAAAAPATVEAGPAPAEYVNPWANRVRGLAKDRDPKANIGAALPVDPIKDPTTGPLRSVIVGEDGQPTVVAAGPVKM